MQVYAGPDADRAKAAFKAADADSSGFLDFRELCAVVKVRATCCAAAANTNLPPLICGCHCPLGCYGLGLGVFPSKAFA
eukprot:353851-Chlamydomonas_euryale.AAC.3